MAFKRKKYKGVFEDTNAHYVCDTTADVASLPTDAVIGSTAFVIENSTRWMINSKGQWIQINIPSSGGGGGAVTIPVRVSDGVLEYNESGEWKPVPLDGQPLNG